MRRLLVLLLAPVILAPLFVLGFVAPASAAASPSIAWDSLESCGDYSQPSTGGWEGQRYFLSQSQINPDTKFRPAFLRLDEPCQLNNSTLGIKYFSDAPTDATGFESYGASAFLLNVTLSDVTCLDSDGNQAGFPGWNYGHSVSPDTPPLFRLEGRHDLPLSGCASLVSFTMSVQSTKPSTTGEGTPETEVVTWSAARALTGVPYADPVYGDDLLELCETGALNWILCDVVAKTDPTSWADTCGELKNSNIYGTEYATWNPLDGATWGPAFAWNMSCLFVPLESFDRESKLADAAEMHPNAAALFGYQTVANALTSTGTCGVVLDASGTVLDGFALDTCTWSWAGAWRTLFLALGIAMLAWWALSYIVNSTFALFNKRIETPVADK